MQIIHGGAKDYFSSSGGRDLVALLISTQALQPVLDTFRNTLDTSPGDPVLPLLFWGSIYAVISNPKPFALYSCVHVVR